MIFNSRFWKWMVAGRPVGVTTGLTYKTVAVAHMNRRLAIFTKKRGGWQAAPTEAGRDYAEHDDYPRGLAGRPLLRGAGFLTALVSMKT